MSSNESDAAAELLRTGAAVPLTVHEETVVPAMDTAEFAVRLGLTFADQESPEAERAEVVEWGALGFLFVIGTLSFADARPRGC